MHYLLDYKVPESVKDERNRIEFTVHIIQM